jgi:small subunit ribosomal protein S1
MATHHVDLPEQVVNPGDELWVKIIDVDLQRRRISLSIKQAEEGGEVAAEYREAFGEHAYDDQGNYVGNIDYTTFDPETESQAAWADLAAEYTGEAGALEAPAGDEAAVVPEAGAAESGAAEGTATPEPQVAHDDAVVAPEDPQPEA